MTTVLEIPRWHPARLNSLKGHWSKGHRLKRADKQIISGYATERRLPPASAKRRVHLHLVLKPGQRGGDPDAYNKSLLDALVHAGLLVDDSKEWVEIAPVTYERGDCYRWGTRITLVDL